MASSDESTGLIFVKVSSFVFDRGKRSGRTLGLLGAGISKPMFYAV